MFTSFALLSSMSLQMLAARGILSQSKCVELQRAYSDPSLCFLTRNVFAAWGKRVS
jgi:hypothetical protein